MLKLAVFTGSSLRHKRLINELELHFKDSVEILWVVSQKVSESDNVDKKSDMRKRITNFTNEHKLIVLISKFKTVGYKKALKNMFFSVIEKIFKKVFLLFHAFMIKRAEHFYYPNLRRFNPCNAEKIVTQSPNSKEIENRLTNFQPDMFISFGGPIYKQHIYSKAKVAINQHAGVSPFYKGSYTTEQAILRSDYNNIGVTIHHVSNLADEGAIIKIEKLQLNEYDSPAKIFIRNCALGNDVIISTIDNYIANNDITGIQQDNKGLTYFAKHLSASHLAVLYIGYFFGYLNKQIKLLKYEN